MKAILIEDEQPARDLVKTYLKSFENIEIIGEFSDGFSGLKGIKDLAPDLLFLDIQLPKLTGFEILELLETLPMVIFTTAYDEFAIKAFEMNAIDYLLKPFTKERFDQAVQKSLDRYSHGNQGKELVKNVLQTVDEQTEILDRVVVKTGSKIKVVATDDIIYLESQDDYVMLYTPDARYMKEKTMKYYETHLDPKKFVRIHRSYIVRIDIIKHLEHYDKDSYIAILNNGVRLKVSSTGYKNLKESLHF